MYACMFVCECVLSGRITLTQQAQYCMDLYFKKILDYSQIQSIVHFPEASHPHFLLKIKIHP